MPNFHDHTQPMDTGTLEFDERVKLMHHLEWKKNLDKTNPEHSRHYCRHGMYAGIHKKCHYCILEEA